MKSRVPDQGVLSTPCTITEAVQISRGVAEDVVSEYQQRTSPLQVSMSLQIEILKAMMIKSGMTTEEAFREEYMKKAKEFEQMQKHVQSDRTEDYSTTAPDTPIMDVKANDIDVQIE